MEVHFNLEGVLLNFNFESNLIVSLSLLLQTHSGSVWRVTWAHPEFGQVLATCSFDRTVGVWEEQRES